MKKENRALFILLITAAIWGFAFSAQKACADKLPPMALGAWRHLMGAVAVYLFSLREKKLKNLPMLDKKAVLPGILIGTVLFTASTLQQYGIIRIGAGKCGFLTALYVVLVPVIGAIFFKKKTAAGTWSALALAVVALYLLCGTEDSLLPAPGDLMALAGAVFWALHILLTDRYSPNVNAFDMCAVQFGWSGFLALCGSLLFEKATLSGALSVWPHIVYLGLLSTAVGYTLQTIGQREANPAHAAIVLSSESVFSVLGGAVLLGERMSLSGYIGCVLMLAAVILSQLSGMKKGDPAHV